ncbi:hypothetical protein BMS3Abin17_00407 [archaeon BMS3Abin17]|nr:hypothetical protein BMS3Abin17_00407 [archaeon BMS3Abin17]
MTSDEIDVLEFSLNNNEIDELTNGLNELKQTGKPIHFDVDGDNQLIIHKEGSE